MKPLNYKVKALIALFLFALSSLVLASPCEEAFSAEEAVAQKKDNPQVESNKTELSNSTSEDKSITSRFILSQFGRAKDDPKSNSVSRDTSDRLSQNDNRQMTNEELEKAFRYTQGLLNSVSGDKPITEDKPMSKLEQAVFDLDVDYILSQKDHNQFTPEELEKAISLIVETQEYIREGTKRSELIKKRLLDLYEEFMNIGELELAVRDLDVDYILSQKDYKKISSEKLDKAISLIRAIQEIEGKTKESEMIESHLLHLYEESMNIGELELAVRDLDVEYILSQKDYKKISSEKLDKAISLIRAIQEIEGKTEESEMIESHLLHLYEESMNISRLERAVRDLDVEYILSQKDYKKISSEKLDKAISLIRIIQEIEGKTEESEMIEDHLLHLYDESITMDKLEQAVRDLDVEYILSVKDYVQIPAGGLNTLINLIRSIHRIHGATKESKMIKSHLHRLRPIEPIKNPGMFIAIIITVFTIYDLVYQAPIFVPYISEKLIAVSDWIRELFKGEQIVDAELIQGNEQFEEWR